MNINWLQVITFAGTAGVISAVVSQLFTYLTGYFSRRRAAAHLSLQIATSLEQFGADAGSAAANVRLYRNSRGTAGSQRENTPTAPNFPDDVEAWRVLRPKLRNRAMSFAGFVVHTAQKMAWSEEMNGNPDPQSYSQDSLEANVRLASGALDLAEDLRRAYRWLPLPPEPYVGRTWLNQEMRIIESQEEAQRAFDAEQLTEAQATAGKKG
jgi:hypothetical protein